MRTATIATTKTLAPLVVILAGLAGLAWLYQTGVAIDSAKGREALIAAIWDHVGYGVVASPLLLGWLAWRFAGAGAARADLTGRLALAVFLALAAAVVFLIVTGPITVWTYGFPVKVFDWFAIPSPTGKADGLHDGIEQAHVFVAHCIPWLAAAEVALVGLCFFRNRKL